jgi:hypothetical protein
VLQPLAGTHRPAADQLSELLFIHSPEATNNLLAEGRPAEAIHCDDWVQQRWLPYTESRMLSVLDTDREGLRAWLRVGQQSLADFARRRGKSPWVALRRIMGPKRGRTSHAMFRERWRRAVKTFTQRHLMQHMLFHHLHTRSANRAWPEALESDWPEINAERDAGLSLIDVGEGRGIPAERVLRAVSAAMRAASRQGVRTRSMSRERAAESLRLDLDELEPQARWRPPSGRATAASSTVRAAPRLARSFLCVLD